MASVSRNTNKTQITVSIDLDFSPGSGNAQMIDISMGIGFLDHMYHALAKHSRFSLTMNCKGDLWINDHHTADKHAQDSMITLGTAFKQALSEIHGICHYGTGFAPLDEASSRVVIDICSHPYCLMDLGLLQEKIRDLLTEMVPHIFYSFAMVAGITLHVDMLRGENDHHWCELAFKALALAIRQAVE
ncbi:IGPD-domain-containing protein [Pisolithus croceorrhizus]|nr:IGPD-domain-containing protein [Pisolithus croceorrhizus]KAI6156247.1 IGPD-domain-containing protein [Pisolithus thermaeus]